MTTQTKTARNHPVHHAARAIAASHKSTEGGDDPSTDSFIQAMRECLAELDAGDSDED